MVVVPRAWLRLLPLVLVMLMSSGCAFYMLDGNAPQQRWVYRDSLPTMRRSQLQANTDRALGGSILQGQEMLSGYTIRSNGNTLYWPLLVGPYNTSDYYLPDAGDLGRRPILHTSDTYGVLWPLYWSADEVAADASTGEAIASRHAFTLGLLYCFGELTAPADRDASLLFGPDELRRDYDLAQVRYDRMIGHALLFGFVAWGEKNGQSFMQLLWIPIPLGPTR